MRVGVGLLCLLGFWVVGWIDLWLLGFVTWFGLVYVLRFAGVWFGLILLWFLVELDFGFDCCVLGGCWFDVLLEFGDCICGVFTLNFGLAFLGLGGMELLDFDGLVILGLNFSLRLYWRFYLGLGLCILIAMFLRFGGFLILCLVLVVLSKC